MSFPPKIKVLAWRFFTSRLPSKDLLLLREVTLSTNSLCEFYGNHPKTLLHLFFLCQVSKNLWERIYRWIGEDISFSFEEFLDFDLLQDKVNAERARMKTNTIWIAALWSLWSMRNVIIFYQVIFSFDVVFYNVMFKSWSWITSVKVSSFSTFYDW